MYACFWNHPVYLNVCVFLGQCGCVLCALFLFYGNRFHEVLLNFGSKQQHGKCKLSFFFSQRGQFVRYTAIAASDRDGMRFRTIGCSKCKTNWTECYTSMRNTHAHTWLAKTFVSFVICRCCYCWFCHSQLVLVQHNFFLAFCINGLSQSAIWADCFCRSFSSLCHFHCVLSPWISRNKIISIYRSLYLIHTRKWI